MYTIIVHDQHYGDYVAREDFSDRHGADDYAQSMADKGLTARILWMDPNGAGHYLSTITGRRPSGW